MSNSQPAVARAGWHISLFDFLEDVINVWLRSLRRAMRVVPCTLLTNLPVGGYILILEKSEAHLFIAEHLFEMRLLSLLRFKL
jgi:hypothetical protein